MTYPGNWYPIALSQDIAPGTAHPAYLHDQELVVWRAANGTVAVWEDRCPHRGMRLSFGFVRENSLSCLYHGWRFSAQGECEAIPAHPDLRPPTSLCATRYPSAEAHGLIWASLDQDHSNPIPSYPAFAGTLLPIRTLFVARTISQIDSLIERIEVVSSELNPVTIRPVVLREGPIITLQFRDERASILIALQPSRIAHTAMHLFVRTAEPIESGEESTLLLWVTEQTAIIRHQLEECQG